jgi:hypothetical protein
MIVIRFTFYQFSGANILNTQFVSKHFDITLTFPPTININLLTYKISVTNSEDILIIIRTTNTKGNIQ